MNITEENAKNYKQIKKINLHPMQHVRNKKREIMWAHQGKTFCWMLKKNYYTKIKKLTKSYHLYCQYYETV